MRCAGLVEPRYRSSSAVSRVGKPVPDQLALDAGGLRSNLGLVDASTREVESVVDYQKAFGDFDAAGGRRALERQLAELDRVAQASVLEGVEPDSRLMALREGLQRLLAALNDLADASEPADPSTENPTG
jgi:hypothetical protein